MKGYIISVMVISFVGGGIMALAPKDGGGKNLRLLCSVCAIACVIFPAFSLFEDFYGFFDKNSITDIFEINEEERQKYDEIYNYHLQTSELDLIENTLKNQAVKDLSLENSDFDIELEVKENSGEFYISRAVLILFDKGVVQDPRKISSYIEKAVDCECEVYYDFK